jgi:hypothetical protein
MSRCAVAGWAQQARPAGPSGGAARGGAARGGTPRARPRRARPGRTLTRVRLAVTVTGDSTVASARYREPEGH